MQGFLLSLGDGGTFGDGGVGTYRGPGCDRRSRRDDSGEVRKSDWELFDVSTYSVFEFSRDVNGNRTAIS